MVQATLPLFKSHHSRPEGIEVSGETQCSGHKAQCPTHWLSILKASPFWLLVPSRSFTSSWGISSWMQLSFPSWFQSTKLLTWTLTSILACKLLMPHRKPCLNRENTGMTGSDFYGPSSIASRLPKPMLMALRWVWYAQISGDKALALRKGESGCYVVSRQKWIPTAQTQGMGVRWRWTVIILVGRMLSGTSGHPLHAEGDTAWGNKSIMTHLTACPKTWKE